MFKNTFQSGPLSREKKHIPMTGALSTRVSTHNLGGRCDRCVADVGNFF